MTGTIGIEWLSGRPHTGAEQDEERAEAAALAVLERHGVTPEAAHESYRVQWSEHEDRDRMTGPALAWIEAERAADIAATEGWDKPGRAHVSIYL